MCLLELERQFPAKPRHSALASTERSDVSFVNWTSHSNFANQIKMKPCAQ